MRVTEKWGEFRAGGPIVLASTIGVALGASPIPFYELGLFAPELAKEFNWSRSAIMGGVFFMMLGMLIMSPIVGMLVDRHGTRRVALTSILLFGAALSLLAVQTGSLGFYYMTWVLIAVLGAGTLPIPWTRAVNEAFETRKGLAMGLTLAGSGLSSLCLKPLMAAVLESHGWRAGVLVPALGPYRFLTAVPDRAPVERTLEADFITKQ
jgi:MFS family permease